MEFNYFSKEIQEWLVERRAKLTSSEIHRIFKGGKRDMTEKELEEEKAAKGKRKTVDTLFGEGAITYIRKKVTEMQSSEIKDEMDFKQTEWGKNNESDGVDFFKLTTGLSVVYHGISCPKFYKYKDFAGGSPDGDIIEEPAVLEMKCPYDEDIHTRRLLIKNLEEFIEQEKDIWMQIQMNIFIMNKEHGYFASFDPRRTDKKLRMKIIKVPACLEWQKEFEDRYDAAVELMAEMLYDTQQYLII
jgi:hypothetical protein